MIENKKTVLITGSTSGIGLGIAKTLANNGHTVILNGIEPFFQPDDIPPHAYVYYQSDLATQEGCMRLAESVKQAGYCVDVLINNAGMQCVAPIETFPTALWEKVIALNLSVAFYLTQSFLPQMYDRNWGRIINIASVHGLVASKYKSAYVAAKHGLLGFTKVLALETAQTKIGVHAICPGWVDTPLVQQQVHALSCQKNISYEEAAQQLILEKQPSGTFIHPTDIGELCLFLLSDAALHMRGSALTIDGGWSIV